MALSPCIHAISHGCAVKEPMRGVARLGWHLRLPAAAVGAAAQGLPAPKTTYTLYPDLEH